MREGPSRPLGQGYCQELRHSEGFAIGKGRGGLLAQGLNRMEAGRIRVGSGRLQAIADPGLELGWSSGGPLQMGEDLGHHHGIFDGGDERKGAATMRIGCPGDREHPFEQLGWEKKIIKPFFHSPLASNQTLSHLASCPFPLTCFLGEIPRPKIHEAVMMKLQIARELVLHPLSN